MRLVRWTPAARADLRSIDRWLEREATPQFAVTTLTAIRERAQFLVGFFPTADDPVVTGCVFCAYSIHPI